MDLGSSNIIFTGENEIKEGRIEREDFFGVKIVNARTCDGKVDPAVAGRWDRAGTRRFRALKKASSPRLLQ
jgi:hypothetical protein